MVLCRRAAEALADLNPGSDIDAAARMLGESHPSMAPLRNLALRLLESRDPARAAAAFLAELDGANPGIAARALPLIPQRATILTHSASQTVFETLVAAREGGRDVSVLATESRPGFEGEQLARSLSERGIPCRLIPDATAYREMAGADLALVGADWISPESVVNKVGTALIALAGRERGKPVYCLASRLKRLPYEPPAEETGLFEATPARYFAALVSEDGVTRPGARS